jgi:hypothetical protein
MARFVLSFVFSTIPYFQQLPTFVFRFVFGYSCSFLLNLSNFLGSFSKIRSFLSQTILGPNRRSFIINALRVINGPPGLLNSTIANLVPVGAATSRTGAVRHELPLTPLPLYRSGRFLIVGSLFRSQRPTRPAVRRTEIQPIKATTLAHSSQAKSPVGSARTSF